MRSNEDPRRSVRREIRVGSRKLSNIGIRGAHSNKIIASIPVIPSKVNGWIYHTIYTMEVSTDMINAIIAAKNIFTFSSGK